jgi:hypothetical protein
MRTTSRVPQRRNGLLAATSAPGLILALAIEGRPLLYITGAIVAATLLLIAYVIIAPSTRPFDRVHALLCLVLTGDRGALPRLTTRTGQPDRQLTGCYPASGETERRE